MGYLRSAIAFLVPALGGLAVLLAGAPVDKARARNRATRLIGHWGTRLAGIDLNIRDPEAAAGLRPAVFVFNHPSGVDPVLLCALLQRDVVGVAKPLLRRHPILGPLLKLTDTVFVDHSAGSGMAALQPALAALRLGRAVAIAPEGHRMTRRGPFRAGALELARAADVALVPVVIRGSDRILPPRAMRMRAGRVDIVVGAPLNAGNTTLTGLEQFYDAQLAVTDSADR